tara:strand:- start:277 stop:498 length:222 start_codon:yes stop_codon:yes gene_type:complete
MSKFYMRLYDFFTSIANYFWRKALAPGKKKINKKEGEQMKTKGLTPKQKKLPKGLQEAILKKQKSTRKKKGKK